MTFSDRISLIWNQIREIAADVLTVALVFTIVATFLMA